MSPSPSKRKIGASSSQPSAKKQAAGATNSSNHKRETDTGSNTPLNYKDETSSAQSKFTELCVQEASNVINRTYYPAEMSNERLQQYMDNKIPRPLETLERTVQETSDARAKITAGDAVLHWFKRDLRLSDNRALSMASAKAQAANVPLICVYVVSPQDYEAHLTSAIRVDFELRTLEIMKDDLKELNIPLVVETVEKRKAVPQYLLDLCKKWSVKHVFCNVEYEVDELRRDAALTQKCLDKGIDFVAVHDDAIVAPGRLQTGAGNQYAVYTPWYRAWVQHIHSNPNLLDAYPSPSSNAASALETYNSIFSDSVPPAPKSKRLSSALQKRYANLWPASEHAAQDRLTKFLESRAGQYGDQRNFPANPATAVLSLHFSIGTLAARTAVRAARDANSSRKLDGGVKGIVTWISELAWRDFYKHVLAHWPYVCMHIPFKKDFATLQWDTAPELFEAWCRGRTGFPIVDAAMRQLNETGWMHNRCRMIVGSFLAKDLLLDWRLGERYFMLRLVDGDFASNNGGWGFSASVGVDAQPYFRIFNPVLQSEKFDADGVYIRKWVPELRDVQGKAVHDPYGRGAGKEVAKKGYPRPIVEHKVMREKALARYKAVGTNKAAA